MRKRVFLMMAVGVVMAGAASAPTTGSAGGGVGAGGAPRNVDQALGALVKVTFQNDPAKRVFEHLRTETGTNFVVNWPALAKAGVTQESPVNLAMTAPATCEEVIRDVLLVLPFKGTAGDFVAGDNAIEITTTAALTLRASPAIYDITRALNYAPTGKATAGQIGGHGALLQRVLNAELARQGEPLNADRRVTIVDAHIAANVSDRGQYLIENVLNMFAQAAKPGATPPALVQSKAAKATEAALGAVMAGPPGVTLAGLVKDAEAAKGKFNVVVLPGTDAAKGLESFVTQGGTVLIGNAEELAGRNPLVVYDLRDIIKRTIARNTKKPGPSAEQVQQSIVASVQQDVAPAGGAKWAAVAAPPQAMAGYTMEPSDGLLIVCAPAATQRAIVAELGKLYK